MSRIPPYQDIAHLTENLCGEQIDEISQILGGNVDWGTFEKYAVRYFILKPRVLALEEADDVSRLCKMQDRVWEITNGSPPPTSFLCLHTDWKKARRARISNAGKGRSSGKIYFIRGGDFIKIGYSTDTAARIATLQIGMPFELKLLHSEPGSLQDERDLHCRFAHLSQRGEWFRADREILDFISEKRSGL